MKIKRKDQQKLILYLLDELEPLERAQLDIRLAAEEGFRSELAALRELHQAAEQRQTEEIDDALLQTLRNSVSQTLRAGKAKPRSISFWSFMQPGPLAQLGFALALLLIGFLSGRVFMQPPTAPAGIMNLQELLTASGQIQTANSSVNPLLAGVERFRYNPQNGAVEITYTTVNDIKLRGNVQDPAVQELLREAMLEEESPNVRLQAVRAAGQLAGQQQLGQQLTETLIYLLEKEENIGVRLKILAVLQQLRNDQPVRRALTRILMEDDNPAMRIGAAEALINGLLSGDDANALRQVAQEDGNSYVRALIRGAIQETDSSAAILPDETERQEQL